MSTFGQTINKKTFSEGLLGHPAEMLVPKVIDALFLVPQFASLFGKSKDAKGEYNLRWADYARYDWSIRELPAVCIYESGSESKEADNGYFTGSITVQVFWPASFRRSDLARIPRTFSAALTSFFASDYVYALLDPHPTVNVDTKVPGLNELGKNMTWTPNVEGVVESEAVPVTMVEVRYRVDMRAWYRFLDTDYRTKGQPFERTLADLEDLLGEYQGIQDSPENVQVVIPQHITE